MASMSLKTVIRKQHLNIFVSLRTHLNETIINFKNTKIHSFLSNIRKPSFCRSGVYRTCRETLLLPNIDPEMELRRKRAQEVKQLYFGPIFLADIKGEHKEPQKHIKDDIEMYQSEDEENEDETEEVHFQYTNAFREGNLLAKVFFDKDDGYPPNPDTEDGSYSFALCFARTSLNARRVDCRVEEWVQCGKACEEFMAGEDDWDL